MSSIKKYGILFLLLLSSLSLSAQKVRALAEVDSSRILIGDHVKLLLTLELPSKALVQWPVFADTLTQKIEIIDKSKIDTIATPGSDLIKYNQVLTITCFDSGSFVIPPVPFFYKLKSTDTASSVATTQAILLYVNTVAVDTTLAIKDIKEPLKAPLTFMEILPWLAGGLGVLLIIGLVIWIVVRKRKNKPVFGPVKPIVPAHVKALKSLEKLRDERIWQQGKIKEYHTRLSDIVRIYLWDRYRIQAIEMTTTETMEAVQKIELTEVNRNELSQILRLADLVKFAKYQPLPDENDSGIRNAISFVTTTAEKIEVVEDNPGTEEVNPDEPETYLKGGQDNK